MQKRCLGIFFLLLAVSFSSSAQTLLEKADSLHRAYKFEEAAALYLKIGLEDKAAISQNALSMTDFCADPHVVARRRFSRKDFFLYYPLEPHSWYMTPNVLDSLGGYPVYRPKDADIIYFSTADKAGTRSLFITEDLDSLWRAPRLAGEAVLSTGSEIFPMLSADEKTLYFASDGLFGMGGFDLYSSTWDAENACWGDPVNLGFPFSSPADDFLLMDTPDGKYTLFASNRDCCADSVYVYVLDYSTSRVRKPVRSHKELVRVASLKPEEDLTRMDNAQATMSQTLHGNANTRLYARKMEEARAIRDSIYMNERAQDALRLRLASASTEGERAALTAQIQAKEQVLVPLRQLLEETNLEIRLVEQTFLQSGVVTSAEDREVVGANTGYAFAKNDLGGKLDIKVASSIPTGAFRRSPVGRFAIDNTLPAGIVYQIQLFSSIRHATLDDIGGLAPVYERLGSNLQYTYSVGMYPSYVLALSDLNLVRSMGFPHARITAYRDGRAIPVNVARQEE